MATATDNKAVPSPIPAFCGEASIYHNVRSAYNKLWDSIVENAPQLSTEVYRNELFQVMPLGVMPPPPGVSEGGNW
ncbi:uncharacterized protein N7459_002811 [Penicillium hispanicum]|uniref:uncharacterized protein n=1 Tax=Penicillium hispanicum TaxID=1080232 RepID=UPI002540DEBF|nr:uncharacterized protein N7459_002811 [Penicillium hispanicum]KAJ5587046.1 hypothetical protein N7459_002811 [Penicillium hispanicum]